MIAGESLQFAKSIVDEIVARINEVPADKKLPLWYLLDSILKNIGDVYTELLQPIIPREFERTFRTVDSATRARLKRLVGTWTAVFPDHVVKSLEKSCDAIVQSLGSAVKSSTVATVAPPVKKQKISPPPHVPVVPQQPHYIHGFAAPMQHHQSFHQPPPPPSFYPPPINYQQQQRMPYGGVAPPLMPPLFVAPANMQMLIGNINSLILQLQQHVFKYPADSIAQGNLAALQQLAQFVSSSNLTPPQFDQVSQQIGSLSRSVQSVIASAPFQAVPPSQEKVVVRVETPKSVSLTTDSIRKEYPRAHAKIYDSLSLQCKQCGFRFANDKPGNEKMTAHLDWHFRQNKRQAQGKSKTSFSRNWFLPESDWINMGNIDTTSGQVPSFFEQEKSKIDEDQPDMLGDESDDELGLPSKKSGAKPKVIAVPVNENKKACAICQESFEKYWDHDQDEWMFRSAVIVDDEYYHKQCFDDVTQTKST